MLLSGIKEKRIRFWRQFLLNRGTLPSLIFLLVLIVLALFADSIAPYSFAEQNLSNSLQLPSAEHWFGTDEFGRDVLSRVIFGARLSLLVGLVAVTIALFLGGSLGLLAGYCGGVLDHLIMRVLDIFFAIPQLLLAISIAATMGPGVTNLMIAVGITTMPRYARLIRASVIEAKAMEYVDASLVCGSSHLFIIHRHILPNCLAPLIVQSTLGMAFAILIAASLSFIGLGLAPPTPEWGAMMSMGREYIRDFPHLTVFPGLAIMLTILAWNFIGDGLRDALDPRLHD